MPGVRYNRYCSHLHQGRAGTERERRLTAPRVRRTAPGHPYGSGRTARQNAPPARVLDGDPDRLYEATAGSADFAVRSALPSSPTAMPRRLET